MKRLTIWHTNDIHSEFEKFSSIVNYLNHLRDREDELLLDAGDFADERSPIVSGSNGVLAMKLLLEAGYDAMAVGNNEFFAGPAKLTEMAQVGLPVLSCNIRKLNGEPIKGIKSHVIIEKSDMRVLIIGVSPFWSSTDSSDSVFTAMADILVLDPIDIMQNIIDSEKENYDCCIVLSHSGMNDDRIIGEKVRGIDMIIGGHSHDVIYLQWAGNSLMHQSGSRGSHLGRVDCFFIDGKLYNARSDNYEIVDGPDEEFLKLVRKYEDIGIENLKTVLYTIGKTLKYDPFNECQACNSVAESLYSLDQCDFALINNGILDCDIDAQISRYSLLTASPSILNPTLCYWRGSRIREAIRKSQEPEFISQNGMGAGFRGKVLGMLSFSHNIQINGDDITVNGEKLDDEKTYAVMSDDYLLRGTGYQMLEGSEKPERYYPGYIRDLLMEKLKNPEIVALSQIRRRK